MALKRMTTAEMVQVGGPWVTEGSAPRKALLANAVLAALVPHLDAAHQKLHATQVAPANPRLAALTAEAARTDAVHDTLIRGVSTYVTGLAMLADTPAEADAHSGLLEFLLPEGLEHTQKTYRGEAGTAELLATRLEGDAGRRKQLKETTVGAKTLGHFVHAWIKSARHLGKLEDERAALLAQPTDAGSAEVVAARNAWIRVVNALLANAALGQVDAATDALLFGALRLAEKTADKRGKSAGAEKPGGTPEPSDSPQPA